MASILTSIKDLFASVLELILSVLGTALDIVEKAFATVFQFLAGFLRMVAEAFKGTLEAAGGVGKFVLGNIFVLGVIAVGFLGFLQYQKSQGRKVQVGDKKLN